MIEPGTRLAGRYRLEDRVHEAGGSTLWKATDETLARPVAVRTFVPGFPRVREVVTAARAASRLTDARLAQVFDADDSSEQAYVVMEWVFGECLEDLLESGPLDPGRAAALVAEAAEALAVAHSSGLAHLCLSPRALVWTSGGSVKLTGLGVDAVLAGVQVDDPALADARGLGRLLYAALTAHWPGDDETRLPPAPYVDGHLCTPRQVRAGVPNALDAITCQALQHDGRRSRPPLAGPGEVVEALAGIPRPALLPVSPVLGATPAEPSPQQPPGRSAKGIPTPVHLGPPSDPGDRPPLVNRTLLSVVVILVMAAIGAGGWAIGRAFGPTASTPSTSPTASSPAVTVGARPLPPASISAFEVDQRDDEHDAEAGNATDDDPATFWQTESYFSAQFGRLTRGAGLVVDLGRPASVTQVSLRLGRIPGADLDLRVADDLELEPGGSVASTPANLERFDTVAQRRGVGGDVNVTLDEPARGRYLLVWFTKLPPREGRFAAEVYDIAVRGSA